MGNTRFLKKERLLKRAKKCGCDLDSCVPALNGLRQACVLQWGKSWSYCYKFTTLYGALAELGLLAV